MISLDGLKLARDQREHEHSTDSEQLQQEDCPQHAHGASQSGGNYVGYTDSNGESEAKQDTLNDHLRKSSRTPNVGPSAHRPTRATRIREPIPKVTAEALRFAAPRRPLSRIAELQPRPESVICTH